MSEFIAGIRKLSITCKFGAFLDEAIRDRIVCGILNSRCRKRMLVETELDLAKAIEFATSTEEVEIKN